MPTDLSETNNLAGMAQAQTNMGNVHSKKGNWSQAEQCYYSVIALYESTNSRIQLAVVLMNTYCGKHPILTGGV